MLDFFRDISGPITMHMELTEACPERCRHCYNFVRDPDYKPRTIKNEDIDFYLDDFKANGGFHVILTGGEPLLAFDKLLYAIEGVKSRGLSFSLNSNLMLATADKMKQLKDAGVDHILSTLFSHDPETHDFIASREGAYTKILEGIRLTREAGIRVSVNMIVTNVNSEQVYDTGKFLHDMGFEKFLANRMIPSTTNSNSLKKEFLIEESAARVMLDDLIRLSSDFEMTVSTCRALPHCFFEDPEKHIPFMARGCNAGKRHLLVGVDGTLRACVHEAAEYGNIHEIGIAGAWEKMSKWRSKKMLPEDCQECSFVSVCEGGCRQIAEVVHGDWSGKDNLCRGAQKDSDFSSCTMPQLNGELAEMRFVVNPDIEVRTDNGFCVVRVFGAKCLLLETNIAEFLIKARDEVSEFTLKDFPGQDEMEASYCLVYDVIRNVTSDVDDASLLKQYKK